MLRLELFTEYIQIASSFEEEDWCTFFTRVLDLLAIYDNDIIRSYIAVNRATLLYEGGVTDDAPLSVVAVVP
jgi:hypothetical protein